MRICFAVLILMTMLADRAVAQSNSVLGCDRKDADPLYCRDGKRRPVCNENGRLVWADDRAAISQGELHFLAMDGRVPMPPCAKPGAPNAH